MSTKTKILFLSNRVPFPIRDGHSRRTYNILKGLAKKNDVYFFSLSEDPKDRDPGTRRHFEQFCTGFECIAAPSKNITAAMIARLLRSVVSFDPYTIWRHYSPAYLSRMRELLQTERFDMIHCDILPLAYTLKKRMSIPCTLTDHDVCHVKAHRISTQTRNPFLKAFTWLEARKLKAFETAIFSRVDLGITVSEYDKKLLQEICPTGTFAVIENGVDTTVFAPAVEETEPHTLLWIGGFGYSPNREAVRYFLESIYPLIQQKVPQVKLNLIGGAVPGTIKAFAARDPSVTILGYVDDPVPFLQRSSVFIAPILSGSGTRLKILEALAAAKAVVTTTVGCEGLEGADKEHYLVADAPRDFANSVAYLLNNERVRKRLGMNARKLAIEKYDWEGIINKMDSWYRRLKSNGQQP